MKQGTFDFGLIGLGVMGRNFILNVKDHGFTAMGNDLDPEKVAALIQEGGHPERINATTDLKEFISKLTTPRKIMLLVPAGPIVDRVIENLIPLVDEGDIIIDGGNSFFTDTDRRESYLKKKGIHFFGTGVSGGAEGARKGPSIMPGGSREAYRQVKPVFEAVAAKFNGEPCVAYLGPKSAGNYVKMVHNGIEYGLMQLTGEIYDYLSKAASLSNLEMQQVFESWNTGRLKSFLIEISAEILGKKDDLTKGFLIDHILDKAKQKGTGKWTSQNAMDLGIPVPTIDMAVSMREISALKDERTKADSLYSKPGVTPCIKEEAIQQAEAALYFGFIITYAQGLHQLAEASKEYNYELNLSTVAKIWRAGCIIRAALLDKFATVFEQDRDLQNLILSSKFVADLQESSVHTRKLTSYCITHGIPMPGITSALSYFDAITSERLPLNLIQAQRDFFGSHTYERTDREGIFHTEW